MLKPDTDHADQYLSVQIFRNATPSYPPPSLPLFPISLSPAPVIINLFHVFFDLFSLPSILRIRSYTYLTNLSQHVSVLICLYFLSQSLFRSLKEEHQHFNHYTIQLALLTSVLLYLALSFTIKKLIQYFGEAL